MSRYTSAPRCVNVRPPDDAPPPCPTCGSERVEVYDPDTGPEVWCTSCPLPFGVDLRVGARCPSPRGPALRRPAPTFPSGGHTVSRPKLTLPAPAPDREAVRSDLLRWWSLANVLIS